MFITELHGEMNVVTFCYIAASIVISTVLWFYNQSKYGVADSKKSKSFTLQ